MLIKRLLPTSPAHLKTSTWLLPQTICNFVSGCTISRACNFHTFNHCVRRNPDNFLMPEQCWKKQSIALLSGHFLKLDKPIRTDKESLLMQDLHYERRRNQNFGPVTVQDSDVPRLVLRMVPCLVYLNIFNVKLLKHCSFTRVEDSDYYSNI